MSNQDDQRGRAREIVSRNYYEHQIKQGKNPNYENVKREINERADRQDKRKDWNIKD